MPSLPIAIHSAEQVRAIEQRAIQDGTSSATLMSRAGAAGFATLRKTWPHAKQIAIVCGAGNNAGDGYVLARYALQSGINVAVFALSDPHKLQGDARLAWQDFLAAGGQVLEWGRFNTDSADVLVDAIFGIGLARRIEDRYAAAIDAMNQCGVPILALDIPSGISANTGHVLGVAIKAQCTITFVGLKIGLFVGEAPNFVGHLEFSSLDTDDCATHEQVAYRLEVNWLKTVLPRREKLAHKGTNGCVLVVGGGVGMAGAARLAAEACLRSGAGLVHVATHPHNVGAIVAARPELIVRGITVPTELDALVEQADVIAVGPGLGQDLWASSLFDAVLKTSKPIVIDADALNLLGAKPCKRDNWVMTPHPGEAARLLAASSADVLRDRIGSVRALVEKYGGTAVLKGANTLCANGAGNPAVCTHGNASMATAGMGDVLTGVIAGIAAQLDGNTAERMWNAARAGVLIHAMAGDMAREHLGHDVERGLIASDLFSYLPKCASPHDRNE